MVYLFFIHQVRDYTRMGDIETFKLRDGTPCAIEGKVCKIDGIVVQWSWMNSCIYFGHNKPTNIEYVEHCLAEQHSEMPHYTHDGDRLVIFDCEQEFGYCTDTECVITFDGEPKVVSPQQFVNEILSMYENDGVPHFRSICGQLGIKLPSRNAYYAAEFDKCAIVATHTYDGTRSCINILISIDDKWIDITYTDYGRFEYGVAYLWDCEYYSPYCFQKKINRLVNRRLSALLVLHQPIREAIEEYFQPFGEISEKPLDFSVKEVQDQSHNYNDYIDRMLAH